jgi:hypothetical protein
MAKELTEIKVPVIAVEWYNSNRHEKVLTVNRHGPSPREVSLLAAIGSVF